MNELSWLIYAADVAGSLDAFAVSCAIGCLGASIAVVAIPAIEDPEVRAWKNRQREYARWPTITPDPGPRPDGKPMWDRKPTFKRLLVSAAALCVLAVVTPGSGTLYAVAASQLGEKVLASATAGKAVKALNSWLDRQIAGAPK